MTSVSKDELRRMRCLKKDEARCDLFANIGMRQLNDVLLLAHTHRWVCEWLFPRTSSDHPVLPPEAFESALAVTMQHELSARSYDALTPPTAAFAPGKRLQSGQIIFKKDMEMLIVPVASVNRITVGYAFCSGHQYSQLTGTTPVSTVAGTHIVTRFAYNMQSNEYLCIAPAVAPGVTGILQLRFNADGSVERNFLVVPLLNYTPDSLPEVVLSSQCNLETRDKSVVPSFQFVVPTAPVGDVASENANEGGGGGSVVAHNEAMMDDTAMNDMLKTITSVGTLSPARGEGPAAGVAEGDAMNLAERLLDSMASGSVSEAAFNSSNWLDSIDPNSIVPSSPASSWSFASNGATDDGVGIPRKPGPAPTSSGAFDMSALTSSLASLERDLKGSFFSLRAKKDVMDPVTGELLSRQTGQQISFIDSVDPVAANKLRQVAAQRYYSTVLSSTIDAGLVVGTQTSAAEHLRLPALPGPTDVPEVNGSANPFSTSNLHMQNISPLHNAAPKNQSAVLAPRPSESSDKNSSTDPSSPAFDKAQAKKIRNRLSAAKSNQRRRQQLEAQRRELIVLHERVEELKKKKAAMLEENAMLKSIFLDRTVNEFA